MYNAEKLRTSVVGFMFGFIVVTMVLDVMTWYYAKGLQLYDDADDGGEGGKDKDSKDRDSGFQVQIDRILNEHLCRICTVWTSNFFRTLQDIELNESKPGAYYKVN